MQESEGPSGIFWFNEDIEFLHDNEAVISSCLEKIITDHDQKRGCLSIVFCSDEHLL